jgi:DNA polymerase III epsilon subunit-like protein
MIEDYIAHDTETGGLDASECALLSIAAVPSWGAEPFSIAVLPNGVIEGKAAQVNGYTPERWAALGAVPEKVAALELRRWLAGLDRRHWHNAAHNAGFDCLYLLALQARTGIDLELPGIWHCTQIKLKGLRDDGILPPGGNRLDDLGKESGFWDLEPRAAQHDALQDARCCAHGLAWIREKKKGGRP